MRRALLGVSVLTAGSGLLQLVAPGMVLERLAGSETPASRHFFATIGMFMVTAGGTLFSALRNGDAHPNLLRWAAGQKFGASAAVVIGVRHKVFSARALPVAVFDLASGVACLVCSRRLAPAPSGAGR